MRVSDAPAGACNPPRSACRVRRSIDMARAFRSVRRDPLTFLGRCSERYGDLVSFPVPGPPALLLNDPADVRHVLQTWARNWGKQHGAVRRPRRG